MKIQDRLRKRERKQMLRSLGRCISCAAPAVTRNHCASHAEQSSRTALAYYYRTSQKRSAALKARNTLNCAIERGEVLRPPLCSRCGIADRKVNGHHHDYSKPLDVTWLCYRCHAAVEGKTKESLT